ncbi:MAG TPA: UvrD-helicase domain-containing protein [Patescibacteria group bacterium]|nr:UvrD-helicase domain-containing protein [Patescibacteria group bacterium]
MTNKTVTQGALILQGLNKEQQQAVTATTGPVLILAGAGSGKTRTLIHRIAYLISEKGVKPWNILAVTFTNKAAASMQERMKKLLGEKITHMPPMGTFHSICSKLLRREIEIFGYKTNFVIYDENDQLTLTKKIMKDVGYDTKQISPNAVHWRISSAKNMLLSPEQFQEEVSDMLGEVAAKVYPLYQSELKTHNALDFDDLIMKTVELFRLYPDVLKKYQELWQYILVDEYQDTNPAQYELVTKLAQKHKNLCVVGDDAQCITPQTRIKTPHGWKKADQIQKGDQLLVAAGRGETMISTVTHVSNKKKQTTLYTIKTKSGKRLEMTPEHMVFGRLSHPTNKYYVYLMYRHDLGYRIGMVKGTRMPHAEKPQHGLIVRGNQERADKMWILKVCDSKCDAQYWEMYFAFTYGIPTIIFCANPLTSLTKKHVEKLFSSINTHERVQKLCADLSLSLQHPHHRPSGTTRFQTERKVLRVDWFAHDIKSIQSPWYPARIALHTTNKKIRRLLDQSGYLTRKSKKNTWRLEMSRRSILETEATADQMMKILPDVERINGAWLTAERKMLMMPASHLHPTMIIPVLHENQIIEDEVVSVSVSDYTGEVIDLNVADVYNFCAGGVIVHNSIYSWRQADIRNILEFEKDYADAQIILLEQNYRSTQTILDASNTVISKNKNQKKKKLWTENDTGEQIIIKEVEDEQAEGRFIVEQILGKKEATVSNDEVAYVDEDTQPDPDETPIQRGESILDRVMRSKMFSQHTEMQQLRGEVAAQRKNIDFAKYVVLYRTNAQSRAIEEAFINYGIPYKLIGGIRFYERREIRDVLAYVRAIVNPHDWVSLERIVNVPARGIGNRTWFIIEQFAKQRGWSVLEAAKQAIPNVQPARLAAFYQFADVLKHIHEQIADLNPTEILDLTLKETGYKEYILKNSETKEQGEARWENILELKNVTQKFRTLRGEEGLQTFLEDIALVSDQDAVDETENAVKLMTVHAAKGLEFPVVFVVGMEEGLFPHSRSLINPQEMEEERRLCYVALTRAIEKVYLIFAAKRLRFGNLQVNPPSRFLDDIPEHLRDWK